MSKNWTYNEGKALIAVYAGRKEEYFHTRNKKHFWENLLTELESKDVLGSATTVENVEVKLCSLYRAYKNAKDRGTGSTPTKFLYMDEMEDIFRDNPIVGSKTAVSVGVENRPEPSPMSFEINDSSENNDSSKTNGAELSERPKNTNKQKKKKQLKDNCNEALELKRKYYEDVIEEKRKKRELLEKYLTKKEQDRAEKNQLILKLLAKKD